MGRGEGGRRTLKTRGQGPGYPYNKGLKCKAYYRFQNVMLFFLMKMMMMMMMMMMMINVWDQSLLLFILLFSGCF